MRVECAQWPLEALTRPLRPCDLQERGGVGGLKDADAVGRLGGDLPEGLDGRGVAAVQEDGLSRVSALDHGRLQRDLAQELGADLTGELVVAHGYPGDWRQRPFSWAHSVQALTRNVFPIDPMRWSKDTIAETELEFEYTRQITEVGETTISDLPSAAGLSGGTIWAAQIQGNPIWSPQLGKILGLIVNRDEDREILRVCRSEHVFWTIKFFFDPNP